jgi:hypothetical protein
MKRIFHPWYLWEDYKYNFYGGVKSYEKNKSAAKYADFLRNLPLFEETLQKVITEWKYSCEHNLTNDSMNRIAYLGQACMAYTYNSPSQFSMGGYSLMTPEEQKAADAMAEKYLNLWLERNKDVITEEI